VVFPQQGFILIPSHLRVLHVTQEAIVLETSAWRNLTFGEQALDPARVPQRLQGPLKGRLGLGLNISGRILERIDFSIFFWWALKEF
jgi:hypothetical protein